MSHHDDHSQQYICENCGYVGSSTDRIDDCPNCGYQMFAIDDYGNDDMDIFDDLSDSQGLGDMSSLEDMKDDELEDEELEDDDILSPKPSKASRKAKISDDDLDDLEDKPAKKAGKSRAIAEA